MDLLLFILYTNEMFNLQENKMFACEDNFSLMAVVGEPANRPAVAASTPLSWQLWVSLLTDLLSLPQLLSPGSCG